MESSASPVVWTDTPLGQAITYLPALGSLIWRNFLYICRILFYPIAYLSFLKVALLAPISIILYVFAPFIVLFQIILGLVIFTPYRALLYLADAVYPIYVLCGIACILGVLLGVSGRHLAKWVTIAVMECIEQKKGGAEASARKGTEQFQVNEAKYEDES